MKRILLAALAILLTACLSPQTAEPTPTATALPTATATVPPIPTSTQTPQPIPTPDVSVMTDDEKIAHVEGYDAENKFPSTIFPNIVILDDGSSYLAYDIQTGEVSSLDEAEIYILRQESDSIVEFRFLDSSDALTTYLRLSGANGSINDIEIHPNAFKHFIEFLGKLPGTDSQIKRAVTINGTAFSFWGILTQLIYTLVTFINSEGDLETVIASFTPTDLSSLNY